MSIKACQYNIWELRLETSQNFHLYVFICACKEPVKRTHSISMLLFCLWYSRQHYLLVVLVCRVNVHTAIVSVQHFGKMLTCYRKKWTQNHQLECDVMWPQVSNKSRYRILFFFFNLTRFTKTLNAAVIKECSMKILLVI